MHSHSLAGLVMGATTRWEEDRASTTRHSILGRLGSRGTWGERERERERERDCLRFYCINTIQSSLLQTL